MAYPDPKNLDDLSREWPTSHVGELDFLSANYAGQLEADIAYDNNRIYVGSYNMPVIVSSPEFPNDFGNQLVMTPTNHPTNSTIYAIDANTGEPIWEFFINGAGFRGGLTVSGGVLYIPSGDGYLYLLNSETGELISKKAFGTGLWTQITIGADASDNMKVFVQTGGQSIASWGPTGIPGALIALGLPDETAIAGEPVAVAPAAPGAPAAPVEERIVEVEEARKIIVEQKIVETETIKTQAIISPLSYLMIIISFIILVISATLFVTSGNWKFGR